MMADGLEQHLLFLKDLAETAEYTQTEPQRACPVCFMLEELCVCIEKGPYWPIEIVASKLEARLRRK